MLGSGVSALGCEISDFSLKVDKLSISLGLFKSKQSMAYHSKEVEKGCNCSLISINHMIIYDFCLISV